MELKSGYKETVIGIFPEDWDLKLFAELFGFRNGVNADKSAYGQGIRFINVLEPITFSHIHGPEITGQVTLPESIISAYFVRRGDVLFNRTSETQEEVALAATYLGTERVVFGGFVIRGRPNAKIFDPVYSGYALRASFIRAQIIPMGQGAVRANVGQENLGRVLAPIPSLPEQRAIADALNDIDQLLTCLDRLLAKKRDLKVAAMQQLLTGKTRLPGFHGKWQLTSLKSILETPVTDGPHLTPVFLNDGIPFLSVNNLVDNKLDFSDLRFISQNDHEVFSRKCRPRKDDILLGKAASVGKVALVEIDMEFNIWSPIAMIRINAQNSPLFVYYQLQSTDLIRQITLLTNSSSQGNIGMGDIEKLTLFLPPFSEQIAIAKVLREMDTELESLGRRRAKTRDVKQGMMQELLTGRIRLV
jgi:type I restriction enzyme S subunit